MKSRIHSRSTAPSRSQTLTVCDKSVLPNGIRIVTETIGHVRSASVGFWIDNGSRDETAGQNGISHFIEHMVFKGTRKRNVREIAESIESVGGYLNAFTGKEHTCYYVRVLDKHLALAMEVLSDLIFNPTFPSGELKKEKGVILEELKQAEDDPGDVINDYFDQALYGDHPIGLPVMGEEKTIVGIQRKDLVRFRELRYSPDRIVIAAAGNIRHEQVVALAKDLFGRAARPTNHQAGGRSTPGALTNPERREYGRPIQQAHICLGGRGLDAKDDDRYALMVLNTFLGDGMSSRLFQNIREKYGFAYTVYSFANMLSDTGSVGAYVGTDVKHIDRCIELVWKEFDRCASTKVSARELERTKEQLKGNMMLGLENIPNRMMRLGSAELMYGDCLSLDEILKRVEAVSPDDIRRLASTLYDRDRFCTVVFRPNGNAAPTQASEDH